MIIGVIGSELQDIQLVCELLSLDRDFQEFDSVRYLSLTQDEIRNCILTKDKCKECVTKVLEKKYGTLMVTGNILFSESYCKRFLSQGNVLVIVSRNFEGSESETQEQTSSERHIRFNKLYASLKKLKLENLYYVDISQENSEELNTLIEKSTDWKDSIELIEEDLLFKELTDLIYRKDNDNMTMEDTIEKAMRELGLEMPEETEVVIDSPKSKSLKKQIKEKEKEKEKEVHVQVESKKNNITKSTEKIEKNTVNSVFIKCSEDSMAILIPENLELTRQVIGDFVFKEVVVELPDTKNTSLQELACKVIEEKVEEPKVQKTNRTKKEQVQELEEQKKVDSVEVSDSSDIELLKEEKKEIDQKIKQARKQGDEELVATLRKQRRSLRAKINRLK